MKDDKEFQIRAANFHYQRIPFDYWEDRLLRLKSLGVNSLESYTFWNQHETFKNEFNFEGNNNLELYLQLAKKLDLLVLLRPGPFYDAEMDFGAMPYFLLKNSTPINLRSFDPFFIQHVDDWWSILFSKVKPHLYSNGGSVVAVQIENEYGSYGNVLEKEEDKKYMEWLVGKARKELGEKVILYSTDGGDYLSMSRGSLNGSLLLTCGDFGPGYDYNVSFNAQKKFNPPGLSPNFVTEFYSGWLTYWGDKMERTSSEELAKYLNLILSLNKSSVSLYMGIGGDNFQFWGGADTGKEERELRPVIQTYDYNAPISENGFHNFGSDGVDKFLAVRNVLQNFNESPLPPEPPIIPAFSYDILYFSERAILTEQLDLITKKKGRVFSGNKTLTFEEMDNPYGYVFYSTILPFPLFNSLVEVRDIHDRAIVLLNNKTETILYRDTNNSFLLSTNENNSQLSFLVENMGRVSYGPFLYDLKGITKEVIVNEKKITNWKMYCLPLDSVQLSSLIFSSPSNSSNLGTNTPTFYRGYFLIEGKVKDTFVNISGWGKGNIFVNGFNLGRYWDIVGPQHTLYLPAPFLVSGMNEFILFEQQAPNNMKQPFISFTDHPIFDF